MFNKRIVLTKHVVDQFIERSFREIKTSDVKKTIFKDLSVMNIKRIEKEEGAHKDKTIHKVWVKGGRQYRVVEESATLVVLTVIQHNRKSNKYANIK